MNRIALNTPAVRRFAARLLALFCFLGSFSGLSFGQKHKNTNNNNANAANNAGNSSGTPTDTDPFVGLDTCFARVLKDWHAAGFAVAVVKKSEVIYSKGFGYRDYDGKLPVTPHTLFAIGSCTKAFTASLIGLLQKDRKVDIDKPVRDYLPALRFYNDAMNNTITLRDMMCHRTGLSRYDYVWYVFNTSSRDSMLQRIQYMEPNAGVREKWQYNNFMFFAQGVVAEKLTGKTWEENIAEKFFEPLGMKETDLSVKDMLKSPDASLGYSVKDDSLIKKMNYYEIKAMGPAGSINSNVTDMSNWLITWINGGKFAGKEILPASYVTEASSAQMATGGGLPNKENPDVYFSDYGFGWFLSSYRGHYRVEHGGNIDGFSASTSFFPSDSIGIVVLSNQNSSVLPGIVRDILSDRLLHLEYKDWDSYFRTLSDKGKLAEKEAKKTEISSQKAGTHLSHSLSNYSGFFTNPGFGGFDISLRHDTLFVEAGEQHWWLRHYHYDVFQVFEKTKEGVDTSFAEDRTKMLFNTDMAGDIASVTMDLEGKMIVFKRGLKASEVAGMDLQKYIGEYQLGGSMTIKVYTKDPKTLYLFVPGQPEYELSFVGNNKFAIKSLSGFTIQFNIDAGGQVTELLSVQPNGTFRASRKK